MARPAKTSVDYFPHMAHSGKTIAILEARWGNDGYAFRFKLLELLGDSSDFTFYCSRSADWEYLLSKTRVSEAVARAILDKLAEVEAIDAECWQRQIVWSDNFVRNLASVFVKRRQKLPQKPGLRGENSAKTGINPTKTDKVKETKPEESTIEQMNRDPSACPSSLRPGVVQQADMVFLTPEELAQLQREYGGEGAARLVTILDAYKTNSPDKGARYRNDYKSILSWGVRELRKEQAALQPGRRASPASAPSKFNARLADIAKGEDSIDQTGDLRAGGSGCQQ